MVTKRYYKKKNEKEGERDQSIERRMKNRCNNGTDTEHGEREKYHNGSQEEREKTREVCVLGQFLFADGFAGDSKYDSALRVTRKNVKINQGKNQTPKTQNILHVQLCAFQASACRKSFRSLR